MPKNLTLFNLKPKTLKLFNPPFFKTFDSYFFLMLTKRNGNVEENIWRENTERIQKSPQYSNCEGAYVDSVHLQKKYKRRDRKKLNRQLKCIFKNEKGQIASLRNI